MDIDLEDIENRLFHGMPISMDETKHLYSLATGKKFPKRVRCKSCGGEGLVEKKWNAIEKYKKRYSSHGGVLNATRMCSSCQGTGYTAVDDG